MLPSKKIMVRTALRSSKQNWWHRRVRTRRQSWVGKLNPISKWLPQKSFPTSSLAEVTCEPGQSGLYSLGRGWFCLRLMKDWWKPRLRRLKLARSSWRCGGVLVSKIQASNSWKDGFWRKVCRSLMQCYNDPFMWRSKKTIQDTLGLPHGLFLCAPTLFLRTRVVFEITFPCFHTSHYWVTPYQLLQSSPKIWRSEEILKAKKEQKASADLEREQQQAGGS